MNIKALLYPLALAIALGLASPSMAQDSSLPGRLANKVIGKILIPAQRHDSSYVTRPALPWTFSVETTLITTGADLTSDIARTDYTLANSPVTNAVLGNHLQRHLHKKIGASIGYRSLILSTSFEVGSKNPGKNRFMSLAFRQPAFGAKIQLIKLHEHVDASLESDALPSTLKITSDFPGTMRTLTLDAYYLFNHRQFSYTAATDGNFVQHRSAGSWMVIGKYLQGDMSLDQGDKFMLSFSNGIRRYTTQQICLGAGYSYNFVPLYRTPSDTFTNKGYRNLTLFLSAIPMATLYNQISTWSTLTDAGTSGKSTIDGNIGPAFTVRTGINFSWDRFAFVATAGYNRFGFRGSPTTVWENGHKVKLDIDTDGVFDDLTAKFSFIVRL